MGTPSLISNFNHHLDYLVATLKDRKNLIDVDLKVVRKDCLWNFKYLIQQIFCCGKNSMKNEVRVDNVSKAIYTKYNTIFSSPESRNTEEAKKLLHGINTQIIGPLVNRTKNKYLSTVKSHVPICEFISNRNSALPPSNTSSAKQQTVNIGSMPTPHTAVQTSSDTMKGVRSIVTGGLTKLEMLNLLNRQAVLRAINQCAYQLHVLMEKTNTENICFAPLSIAAVLGMVLKGKSSEAKKEFLNAMGLTDMAEEAVHKHTMEILNDLAQATGDQCIITFANAVAVMPGFRGEIDPLFIQTIKEIYQGEIFPVKDVEGINQWISQKTRGFIPNLLETMPDLKVALINAMYFSASWQKEFDEVFRGLFTFANGTTSDVQMIQQQNEYPFYECTDFRMLEIPYKAPDGHHLSCVIFLPNSPDRCSALTSYLTPNVIENVRINARKQKVNVTMPKINVNAKVEELLEMLKKIGLPLDDVLPYIGNLQISDIIHQAKLKIDEKGAEGAAATAVLLKETFSVVQKFEATHDFIYFIMDGNAPLFQGTIRNPSALVK